MDAPALERARPDAARGVALAERFECARCHTLPGPPRLSVAPARNCAGCHAQVAAGTVATSLPRALRRRWARDLRSLRAVPSLEHVGERLRRTAIAAMIAAPHDARPSLIDTMPRLRVTAEEAEALAGWLAPEPAAAVGDAELDGAWRSIPSDARTVAEGARLYAARGCAGCHVGPHGTEPPSRGAVTRPVALAPDLRRVRARVRPDRLVPWLLAPASLDPGTAMPALLRSRDEAVAVAAFLVHGAPAPPERPEADGAPGSARGGAPGSAPAEPGGAPAAPASTATIAATPPRPVARRVGYAEVRDRVFRRSCWHCHSDGELTGGDAGPGASGGFGFAPRGFSVSSASAVRSGAVGDDRRRRSVTTARPGATPRLLEVLRARAVEAEAERGSGRLAPGGAGVTGMPLGLPPLDDDALAIVEGWLAAGAPD